MRPFVKVALFMKAVCKSIFSRYFNKCFSIAWSVKYLKSPCVIRIGDYSRSPILFFYSYIISSKCIINYFLYYNIFTIYKYSYFKYSFSLSILLRKITLAMFLVYICIFIWEKIWIGHFKNRLSHTIRTFQESKQLCNSQVNEFSSNFLRWI